MARVQARLEFFNTQAINQIGMREARRLVTDATRATYNRAQVLTPVDTGNLRSGNNFRIYQEGLKVFGEVFNQTEYAAAVHNGSRAHTVYPKRHDGVLRFKVGGRIVYARHATIPARKGRPWLAQALEQVAPRYGFRIEKL